MSVWNRQEPTGEHSPRSEGWVGIAANANSGIGRGRERVDRLVRALEERQLDAKVSWTLAERANLVAEATPDSGCRCLVAAGGDGTVAALINERPRVPITVLRAGTENLFAQHFRLPQQPERLAALIASGRIARLDLGQTAGRRFALMAGIGFDADVVTRHHLIRVGRAGIPRPTHRGTYVEPVLRASFSYKFPPLKITIDGADELVGTSAFVFNLPRYALGLPFAPQARGDDGLLDLVVFRDAGPWRALRYLWLVLRGLHLREPGVSHHRVRHLTISCDQEVPVQLDGDPGGMVAPGGSSDPWTAEIVPGAIDVVVPQGLSSPPM